jgi:site-specific recombinase XerD
MMGLIIYQALDCGSLASLQVKDIDLQKAKIHIPAKTIDLLNSRTLPLESIQILPLKDYIENTRPAILKLLNLQNDYLFPYSQQIQVKRLIVSIHKKIKTYHNIKEFKDLRQSRIALWLKQYEIRTVQYKTGFKKLQSFEKYKKTQIESLQEAINKYHIF